MKKSFILLESSQRTAPRALTMHLMAKTGFGSPSTPYSVRTWNARRFAYMEKSATYFRTLHQSGSELSIKSLPSVKSSKSDETVPEKANIPQTSIVKAITAIQWNNWRSSFTPSNVLQFFQHLPANTMAAYMMVINSREYELARGIVLKTCQLTVHIGRTAYLWLGLFLESREYYYCRYYTLLSLEYTIKWLRYGLRSMFDLIRSWAAKNGP
uniref:Uncharacterized protein n=1 Tax=Anopheles funestus TaxID=62324 RepID=A0A182RF11_ANOFN